MSRCESTYKFLTRALLLPAILIIGCDNAGEDRTAFVAAEDIGLNPTTSTDQPSTQAQMIKTVYDVDNDGSLCAMAHFGRLTAVDDRQVSDSDDQPIESISKPERHVTIYNKWDAMRSHDVSNARGNEIAPDSIECSDARVSIRM